MKIETRKVENLVDKIWLPKQWFPTIDASPTSPSRCDAEITLVALHLFAPQPLAKTRHSVMAFWQCHGYDWSPSLKK